MLCSILNYILGLLVLNWLGNAMSVLSNRN